jgi:hypothetical protein
VNLAKHASSDIQIFCGCFHSDLTPGINHLFEESLAVQALLPDANRFLYSGLMPQPFRQPARLNKRWIASSHGNDLSEIHEPQTNTLVKLFNSMVGNGVPGISQMMESIRTAVRSNIPIDSAGCDPS